MTKPSSKNLHTHYLKPGEFFLSEQPALVTTLLGSCVSVTMYSPRLQLGAICHGLLPSCREKNSCDCIDGFRYVECAIRRMLNAFRRRGMGAEGIEVKIFGGADMFSFDNPAGKGTIGRQNIEKAMQVIDAAGLNLLVSDVGGDRGRKLYFYTHTGEVLLKRLRKGSKLAEGE